jgi:geranylgeranyl pyrophosphate synthase
MSGAFDDWMKTVQAASENDLSGFLPAATTVPTRLHAAMRYTLLGGGKRVRPLLVYAAGALFGADAATMRWRAPPAAVEMIHAYSLVHDDMPCMDDDELRRGKPTVHVAYDEATALLVGDALQSQAFMVLADGAGPDVPPARQLAMLRVLAQASGSAGMCGGQAIDLDSVGLSLTLEQLEQMHSSRPARCCALQCCWARWPARIWMPHELGALNVYARAIGLAFQVVDDVLDATADSATLGKTAGKDAADNKPTYVSILGLEPSQGAGGKIAARGACRRWRRLEKKHAVARTRGPDRAAEGINETARKNQTGPGRCASCRAQPTDAAGHELRAYLLDSVSKTGGHLSSNLGTVELTIALHYVFNTPHDRIVWDVGHQTYRTRSSPAAATACIRCASMNGMSGFPKRDESEYDTFGTAHSSTSISAALGMAQAAKIKGEHRHAIAVIGDGSMTAGMAFEALNNAGVQEDVNLLVILNDNDMSISPPVGALNRYLARLMSGQFYAAAKNVGKSVLPAPVLELAKRLEEHAKGMVVPATMFEEFGFNYIGPIDGHDLESLIPTLQNIKQLKGPQFLHVVTKKGQGYKLAEAEPILYHGTRQVQSGRGHQAGRRAGQENLHRSLWRLAVRHGRRRQEAWSASRRPCAKARAWCASSRSIRSVTSTSASPSSTP